MTRAKAAKRGKEAVAAAGATDAAAVPGDASASGTSRAPRKSPFASKSASKSAPGVRAQKAAARREAILTAALDEFSAQGFAATRLDDVAKRAGVAKGTIYLHFADKETLFQEIIRSVLSPVVVTVESALLVDVPIRTIAEKLVDVFVREVYGTRRKDVIRLILSEGARFPAIAEFYYREVLSKVFVAMRALLRRAAERGEIKGDALIRFPQLMGAPIVIAIIWNGLFERFEPLDVRAFLNAHLDVLFGPGRAT